MTKTLYRVVNWDDHFETYESKRLARGCSWVATPNKHDGRSFRRLLREKDGEALYGAWALIVQVASKMPLRGTLADLDGPLDALDIEDKTGARAKTIERAFEMLTSERIGWLQRIDSPAEVDAILREIAAYARGARGRSRSSPAYSAGASADSAERPQPPATADTSPAACGQNGDHPQAVRGNAAMPDPRGRAQADRTGPDSTSPHRSPAAAPVVSVAAALEATAAFILGFFSKKRNGRRLGREAMGALADQSAALPLTGEQQRLLRWWMELPNDETDPLLRHRPSDADKLAIRLFQELDRAEQRAEKMGGPLSDSANSREPEGWRDWFAGEHADLTAPAAFADLPDYLRDDFRRWQKRKDPRA